MTSLSEKRKVSVNEIEYHVGIQFDDGKWEVSIDGNLYEVEIDKASRRGQRKKRDSSRGGSPSSGLISSVSDFPTLMISQRDISMLLIGPRLFFLQNCSQCFD